MKIDDKDIEKMLENFSGEEIEVPKELDERLNQKLEIIKPKKSKKTLIAIVASILVISLSYTTIPSFRTFADGVIKYIFGDAGIDNAIEHGYEFIPSQTINIEGYDIEISNIYMDKLRLGFDARIKSFNNKSIKKYDEELELSINDKSLDGSYSADYALLRKDGGYKAKVEILGDAVTKLYNKKLEKIELELVLTKNISYELDKVNNTNNKDVDAPIELKSEVIGNYNLVLDMPDEIYKNKEITINKIIKDDKLELDIQKLEISPTMMYLFTEGNLDGYNISGLYNLQIISNEKTYKENLDLVGIGRNNQWQQTIVPSIYYDNRKDVKLKADGVHVWCTKDIEINANDIYPKKVEYFNDIITINRVERIGNELEIEIIGNTNIDHATHNTTLDKIETTGVSDIESEENGKVKKYIYHFDIEEKDKYILNLSLIVKYPKPIELDIKLN